MGEVDTFDRRCRLSAVGTTAPTSHLETVCRDTPNNSANDPCKHHGQTQKNVDLEKEKNMQISSFIPGFYSAQTALIKSAMKSISKSKEDFSSHFSGPNDVHFFEFAHDAYKDQQKGHKN